jgi:hypothetical protein
MGAGDPAAGGRVGEGDTGVLFEWRDGARRGIFFRGTVRQLRAWLAVAAAAGGVDSWRAAVARN